MSLPIDPSRTALVLIDFQAGILGMPLSPHPAAALIEKAVGLATRLLENGGIVVPVNVAWSPDLGDRPSQAVDEPMRTPPTGLPPGWSDLAPEIAALPTPFRITKRHWGAFGGTELDLQLRRRGIATNFGVESTAREAWQLGYDVVIVEDATSSISEEMHRFSIEKVLPRIARIRHAADLFHE